MSNERWSGFEMSATPKWHIKGDWFDNCRCAVACPCTFGQAPDNNLCEFVMFWHIREGQFEKLVLNGLSVLKVGVFEGNIWDFDARGRSGMIIDNRASEAQVAALLEIFSGRVGGMPEVMRAFYPRERESLGSEQAKIDFEIAPNQSRWGVDVSGKVKAWAEALKGPTSTSGEPPRMSSPPGSETGPGQIVTWGKSTVCKVDVFGLNFSWTVSSAKHIPFDWSGDSLPVEIP